MIQILLKLLPTSMSGLPGAQGFSNLAGNETDFKGTFAGILACVTNFLIL